MKCPFCNGEMRHGYIQGARGVIFSERIKKVIVKFSGTVKTVPYIVTESNNILRNSICLSI